MYVLITSVYSEERLELKYLIYVSLDCLFIESKNIVKDMRSGQALQIALAKVNWVVMTNHSFLHKHKNK